MITQALFKVLPVLLLLGLGHWLSRRQLLSEATRADLKKLIVNITLPSTLFLAFLQVQLEVKLLAIPAIIFSANLLVFLLARKFGWPSRQLLPPESSASPGCLPAQSYLPYLLAGYEAGMLGYAIYGAVYGEANIFKFGLIDLGQVVFVFFVLIPSLVSMEADYHPGAPQVSRWIRLRQTLTGFLKTPVILSILGGIAIHQVGWVEQWGEQPWMNSLLVTIRLLAAMTTPLVALVIGAEIKFADAPLSGPVRTMALRLLIWVPAALLFNAIIISAWLGLDSAYLAAVLTMAVLPAPFVTPLFMRRASAGARSYVVNSLSLMTLVTLAAFVLVTILIPPV